MRKPLQGAVIAWKGDWGETQTRTLTWAARRLNGHLVLKTEAGSNLVLQTTEDALRMLRAGQDWLQRKHRPSNGSGPSAMRARESMRAQRLTSLAIRDLTSGRI